MLLGSLELEIVVSFGAAATGGSTDGITVVTIVVKLMDVVVAVDVVIVAVGSVATVVVLKVHLCQRILMSQAGGSGRCVVVTETLVVVGVLS